MQVRDNPVAIPDLSATIFQKLGVDYTKEHVTPVGRPFKLSEGTPLKFL
jgi:hypothetical protein